MSKLVDDMLSFFQDVKTLGSPNRVKEDLVIRSMGIEGLELFEDAAEAEITFLNSSRMLQRELEQLKVKFTGAKDLEYCPELDRFLNYANFIRSALSKVPRSRLDDEVRDLLKSKHQDATKSQLDIMALRSKLKLKSFQPNQKQLEMKPFYELAADFCKYNPRVSVYILKNWKVLYKNNDEGQLPPPTTVPDGVEMCGENFVTQDFKNMAKPEQGCYNSDIAKSREIRTRPERSVPVPKKFVTALLTELVENTKEENLKPVIEILFTGDIVPLTNPNCTNIAVTTFRNNVQNSLKLSHRHAIETISKEVEFGERGSIGSVVWSNLYGTYGETYHLDMILAQMQEAAAVAPSPEIGHARGPFEVSLLNALLDAFPGGPESAAIRSSMEALTLYSQYTGTAPDKGIALKDPSSLLRVQSVDTSAVKLLNDTTGYRVVFPVLSPGEEPEKDVHVIAHQILNPYLLDVYHRSDEMKGALQRAWEQYVDLKQAIVTIGEQLQTSNIKSQPFRFE